MSTKDSIAEVRITIYNAKMSIANFSGPNKLRFNYL